MKATFLNPGKLFTILDIDNPKISSNELLLKVESCAICGSDLKIAKYGNSRINSKRIIGHEISGTVKEIGSDVSNFKIGDKVAIGADLPCHDCEECKVGNVNNCNTNLALGYQFDGGFAENIILNEHVLRGGPIQRFQNSSFDLACLAEPLACAINGVEKSLNCHSMGAKKKTLIFGGGPMGIMIAEYLKFLGFNDIFISEPNEFRLKFIDSKTNFKIFDKSLDTKFDLIFTACPVIESHIQSLKLIAKSGVVNFFGGLPESSKDLSLSSNFVHYNEIVITGSHGSNPIHHKKALDLLEGKLIDIEYLITHRYNLDQINDAFVMASSGKAQKIIIKP